MKDSLDDISKLISIANNKIDNVRSNESDNQYIRTVDLVVLDALIRYSNKLNKQLKILESL